MNDFLTFTKGERVAIIVLAAVIFLLIAANFFVIKHKPNVNENSLDIDSIMALHETAIEELNARKLAEQLEREARIKKAKEENERIKKQKTKKPEFKKDVKPVKTETLKKEILIVNINTTDTMQLLNLPEIGPFFARNIVEYRKKLGGFIDKKQLLEIYGFDSVRYEIISPYIIIDSVAIRRLKVNHDDFKTLLRHPYIEYDDVKKIVNYRETKGMITNWEQYKKVVKRDDVDERLWLYLEF